MKNYSTIIALVCMLIFQNSYSQSITTSVIDKDYLKKSLENYFSLDRENIYLHLNKNQFLTSESIWFKGYITNRKGSNATIKTTNIQIALLNDKGEKVRDFIFFANNNSFSGNISLDEKYPTGKYYLQAYTNWMNNFSEDESSTYPITITNIDQNNQLIADNKPTSINVTIHPEGGLLVANIKNSIGINVSKEGGKALANTKAWLVNSKKEKLMLLPLNESGNGRFDFIPNSEEYFILAESDNKVAEKKLPQAASTGIALVVNNYYYDKKTVISAITNKETIEQLQNQPLYFIIHKDDKSHILDLKLSKDKNEETFEIPNNILFNGVNHIRIVDSNGKQYAERMIFNTTPIITNNFEITKIAQDNNTSTIAAKTSQNNYNLSIAVQPEYNNSTTSSRNIISDLMLNPYLAKPIVFNKQSVSKQATLKEKFDLDLLLLNQNKYKYDWKNMLANPPKKMYANENGLTLVGSINESLKNYDDYKVRFYSINNLLMEFSDIDKNGQFEFGNLYLPDSIPVHFTFYKKKNLEEVNLKYTAKIKSKDSKFNHSFIPSPDDAVLKVVTGSFSTSIFDKKAIQLKEVIQNSSTLKHQDEIGGLTSNRSMQRAYKVKTYDQGRTVISYLNSNGFYVNNSIPVMISPNRQTGSFLNYRTIVYLDNLPLMDYDRLFNLFMGDIDEIYTDNRFNIIEGTVGIIKLYSKQYKDERKNKDSFIITNGYNFSRVFTPEDSLLISDSNHKDLNCIYWLDNIESSGNGIVNFDIPNTSSKEVKLAIEGISNDGQLISTSQVVKLK